MQVKVCDLKSSNFKKDFLDSITNTGFAVITNHGIDYGLIKDLQKRWRLFFLSDDEYKNSFKNPKDSNMGYAVMKKEKAVGATKPDLKEFMHWKPGQSLPDGVWALTQQIFYNLEDLGLDLLRILDSNMTRSPFNFAEACWQSDSTLLRTLYYPAMDFSKEEGAVRAAAHEDINFITLLVAASSPGLQVKDKEGNWYDVPNEDNSIVVNIGDQLELASGGLYKSTTHRVINPEDFTSDRVSMPLFIHPEPKTILADGITAKQFLDQRLKEIYGQK